LDAIRDIIYQVIPKLLFKNNNKKVSENTAKSNIYLMFVLPRVGTAQQRGNKTRGYNGIIYGSYKMVGCPIVK
jgi:hypothetical protein